jgi:hypothetical protein
MIAMSDMPDEMGKKEMYLKTYKQGGETLVAVCDCDVLGRRFEQGQLHLDVSADFFGCDAASCEEVEKALVMATMANFVGCKTVEHAISLGYVDKDSVLSIGGVLYAQMVKM